MTAASTIIDRVAEMHAMIATKPRNEAMAAFGREQAALASAGVPEDMATVGPPTSSICCRN